MTHPRSHSPSQTEEGPDLKSWPPKSRAVSDTVLVGDFTTEIHFHIVVPLLCGIRVVEVLEWRPQKPRVAPVYLTDSSHPGATSGVCNRPNEPWRLSRYVVWTLVAVTWR